MTSPVVWAAITPLRQCVFFFVMGVLHQRLTIKYESVFTSNIQTDLPPSPNRRSDASSDDDSDDDEAPRHHSIPALHSPYSYQCPPPMPTQQAPVSLLPHKLQRSVLG